ncbi:MAG: IS66 family transposase, partial [Chloroflexi bacterium]|nr:IS66 family transposase [Chloroflexota bacterium]
GSQSAEGAAFVARILSVAATCKQHDRPLLPYLTDVCLAAHHALRIPSLLPIHAAASGA